MRAPAPENSTKLAYSGHRFDRAAGRRSDAGWLARQRGNHSALVLPIWRDNSLIDESREPADLPAARFVDGDAAVDLLASRESVLLGINGEAPVFACDLSDLDLEDARAAVHDTGEESSFIDLRRVGAILPHGDGALLAFARGMTYWHRRTRFCGVCGQPTRTEDAGHLRRCNAAGCATPHFPRTDPAVIMLVTHRGPEGERCLLGRQPSWPDGLYSSLAGFVEPGESLESAVEREVYEEARIRCTDVEYRASQPWPFPSSLMLGFRARALTTEIDTADDELEHADWFTRDEIRGLYSTGGADDKLSRSDSIARWLIEDWLAEGR